MVNQNLLSSKNILREGGLSQDSLKWRKIWELVTNISYLKMTKRNSLYKKKIIKKKSSIIIKGYKLIRTDIILDVFSRQSQAGGKAGSRVSAGGQSKSRVRSACLLGIAPALNVCPLRGRSPAAVIRVWVRPVGSASKPVKTGASRAHPPQFSHLPVTP